MEVDVGRPAAAFEHELASKDMIVAHSRRTGEELVCHGAFRNEFQKRKAWRRGTRDSRVCYVGQIDKNGREMWTEVKGFETRLANPLEVVRCALPRACHSACNFDPLSGVRPWGRTG